MDCVMCKYVPMLPSCVSSDYDKCEEVFYGEVPSLKLLCHRVATVFTLPTWVRKFTSGHPLVPSEFRVDRAYMQFITLDYTISRFNEWGRVPATRSPKNIEPAYADLTTILHLVIVWNRLDHRYYYPIPQYHQVRIMTFAPFMCFVDDCIISELLMDLPPEVKSHDIVVESYTSIRYELMFVYVLIRTPRYVVVHQLLFRIPDWFFLRRPPRSFTQSQYYHHEASGIQFGPSPFCGSLSGFGANIRVPAIGTEISCGDDTVTVFRTGDLSKYDSLSLYTYPVVIPQPFRLAQYIPSSLITDSFDLPSTNDITIYDLHFSNELCESEDLVMCENMEFEGVPDMPYPIAAMEAALACQPSYAVNGWGLTLRRQRMVSLACCVIHAASNRRNPMMLKDVPCAPSARFEDVD